jgi:Ras-related C3 botulinum toxin substrate 1
MSTCSIKACLVGDKEVGKTAMVMSYKVNKFLGDYVPTSYDIYSVDTQVNGRNLCINIMDLSGGDGYAKMRAIAYKGTKVFIVCFSLINRASFENVLAKWRPELGATAPRAPIVLVGTKADLKSKGGAVSESEGRAMASQIGAVAYVECSTLTQQGLRAVFDAACQAVRR